MSITRLLNYLSQAVLTYSTKHGLAFGLAEREFSPETWEQFTQLLGYDVYAWCDLSYVSEEAEVRVLDRVLQLAQDIVCATP